METIDLRNIDTSKLFLLNPDIHTESDVYTDYNELYKIFNVMSRKVSKRKEQKVEILSSLKSRNVLVLPNQKVVFRSGQGSTFVGYRMRYINGQTLHKKQFRMSMRDYLNLLRRISLSVKSTHREIEGFTFGDLNFDNILITRDLKHHFIDLDSATIGNLQSERISELANNYIFGYRNARLNINNNFDRLTLLLHFLFFIFAKPIEDVKMYEYDMNSERLRFLRTIKPLILELKKRNRGIPNIPYLHEFIREVGEEKNQQKVKMLF